MRAEIIPEIGDGQAYKGEVSTVDPVVDAASGTFGVRIDLPNPEKSIPGGLKCKVRMLLE